MTGSPPAESARLDVRAATGTASVDGVAFSANVAKFARLLRQAGLDVEPGQTATFLRALALLGFDRRGDVRAAGRAIFVRRREDVATYDAEAMLEALRPRLPRR